MKKFLICLLSVMFLVNVSDSHNQVQASIFGKVKDKVKDTEKKAKKKAKKAEKKLKKKAKEAKKKAEKKAKEAKKKAEKTAKGTTNKLKHNANKLKHEASSAAKKIKHHDLKGLAKQGLGDATHAVKDVAESQVKRTLDTIEKAADVIQKVSGPLTNASLKILNKLPGGKIKTCATSGFKIVQGVEQMAVNSTFPKDFCPNFNKFHHAGCSVDDTLINLLGSKVKILKKYEKLNSSKCTCLERIFDVYGHAMRGSGVSPQTCKDAENAIHCCDDIAKVIPEIKHICSPIEKIVHKAESPCKKLLGTCPVMVANIAGVIAEIAATAEIEEVEEEQLLNDAVIVCHNIEEIDQKNCCKIGGPLAKECKPITQFGDRVCQTIDCPLKMFQFIQELEMSGGKNPDCEKLNEIQNEDCCASAKYLPGALKNVVGQVCKKFHTIVEKADKLCGVVDKAEGLLHGKLPQKDEESQDDQDDEDQESADQDSSDQDSSDQDSSNEDDDDGTE